MASRAVETSVERRTKRRHMLHPAISEQTRSRNHRDGRCGHRQRDEYWQLDSGRGHGGFLSQGLFGTSACECELAAFYISCSCKRVCRCGTCRPTGTHSSLVGALSHMLTVWVEDELPP